MTESTYINPVFHDLDTGVTTAHSVSLRDVFACFAMAGMWAQNKDQLLLVNFETLAVCAYNQADAMLIARQQDD